MFPIFGGMPEHWKFQIVDVISHQKNWVHSSFKWRNWSLSSAVKEPWRLFLWKFFPSVRRIFFFDDWTVTIWQLLCNSHSLFLAILAVYTVQTQYWIHWPRPSWCVAIILDCFHVYFDFFLLIMLALSCLFFRTPCRHFWFVSISGHSLGRQRMDTVNPLSSLIFCPWPSLQTHWRKSSLRGGRRFFSLVVQSKILAMRCTQ